MAEKDIVTFDPLLLEYLDRFSSPNVSLEDKLLNEELCKATDHWGTLLHYAARSAGPRVIEKLIKLGSNVNALNQDGKTPLMLAFEGDNLSAMNILVSAKADVHVKGPRGLTLLQIFFQSKPYIVDHRLFEVSFPMIQRVTSSNEKFLQTLFNAGCTAYHAVYWGDSNIVKALLKRGVDVNCKGHLGRTPLIAAVILNDFAIVKLLISHGADVNALDDRGSSALLHSLLPGSQPKGNSIRMELLEHGADINVRDDHGYTPLFWIYWPRTAMNTMNNHYADFNAEYLLLRDALPQNSTHMTILGSANMIPDCYRTKLLIAHIAMLDMLGNSIIESLVGSSVDEYRRNFPKFAKYHDLCQRVLEIPVFGSSTLLDLLNQSQNKIKMYLRNENFVPQLEKFYVEHDMELEYPLYYKKIEERLIKATRLLELESKVLPVIFKLIETNNYFVAREIIDYLNVCDLENLCHVED